MAEVAELCLSSDTDVSDDFEEGESQQDDATPPRSKKAKVALSGAARYSTKFNADWRSEFPFVSSASDGSEFSFYCKVCTKDFSCHHQGKADMDCPWYLVFWTALDIMLLCFPTFTEALSTERPTQLIHGTCKSIASNIAFAVPAVGPDVAHMSKNCVQIWPLALSKNLTVRGFIFLVSLSLEPSIAKAKGSSFM